MESIERQEDSRSVFGQASCNTAEGFSLSQRVKGLKQGVFGPSHIQNDKDDDNNTSKNNSSICPQCRKKPRSPHCNRYLEPLGHERNLGTSSG